MKSIVHWLLFLLIAAGAASAQAARLYKWVDEDGRVSYHDRPPPEGSAYKVERKEFKSKKRDTSSPYDVAVRDHPVALYSSNRCAPCDMARSYLEKRNVPFTEKNVQLDDRFMKELVKLSGNVEVPVIAIGSRIVKGFSQEWLDSELSQAGYTAPEGSETVSGK